jgi:hypothetical protein
MFTGKVGSPIVGFQPGGLAILTQRIMPGNVGFVGVSGQAAFRWWGLIADVAFARLNEAR